MGAGDFEQITRKKESKQSSNKNNPPDKVSLIVNIGNMIAEKE